MKNNILKINRKVKKKGQVYTPIFIVNNILDEINYHGNNILKKHIIDNSCGDGIFILNIINRYIKAYLDLHKTNSIENLEKKELNELILDLETYIHGIEIQKDEYFNCIRNINLLIKNNYGIQNKIKWNIINGDTLIEGKKLYNKMDYVVGNPPYVKIHNLENNYNITKEYNFTQDGMIDLYLAFWEISINMLKDKAKVSLITPSSFLQSNAGVNFRKYIKDKKELISFIDFEHIQLFKGYTTYSLISTFQKNIKHKNIKYYNYDLKNKTKINKTILSYDDIFIENKIFLSKNKLILHKLKNIFLNKKIKQNKDNNLIEIKNGFATLSDNIFIKEDFNFEDLIINIKKASKGIYYKALFPYDKEGKPLSLNYIKNNHIKAYNYLIKNKEKLLNRSIKNLDEWYLYGRSQGLKDINKEKISISFLIKNIDNLKIEIEKPMSGVYSGLYILYNHKSLKKKILNLLFNIDFISYIKSLRKYKNGGYYTFSSKDLYAYLISNL